MKTNKAIFALAFFFVVGVSFAAPAEEVVSEIYKIDAANDEWTTTAIKVNAGDIILVDEPGNKITVGAWLGRVGADASPGNDLGALYIKIGTGAGQKVGSHGYVRANEPGIVKFKVNDTNYKDNSGFFMPRVVVIPASMIPEPREVEVVQ